jgi:hypothetical protein
VVLQPIKPLRPHNLGRTLQPFTHSAEASRSRGGSLLLRSYLRLLRPSPPLGGFAPSALLIQPPFGLSFNAFNGTPSTPSAASAWSRDPGSTIDWASCDHLSSALCGHAIQRGRKGTHVSHDACGPNGPIREPIAFDHE